MASEARHLFFLFTLFFFSSFVHAKLELQPSDLKALRALQRDLGLVNGQHPHPCNAEGVFCERRLSNNRTFVLRIITIVLNSKRLNGTLSPAVGCLTELKELFLPNNHLVDRIPQNIVHLTKLEILDLRNNLFSGEVPSQLSSLIRLRVLDVSSNKLSGNLNFLTYFPNLEKLDIADNLFTGRVPASIRSFQNLRHFNFSGNRLFEGFKPLAKRLEEDTVPKRFIFGESSRRSNLSSSGGTSAPAPAPAPSQVRKMSKREISSFMLGFVAFVAVAFSMTIYGVIFCVVFERALALVKGGGKGLGCTIYSPLIKRPEDLAFLEKDHGLDNLEIIGRGGCGVVFKAKLPGSREFSPLESFSLHFPTAPEFPFAPSNGKMIAIKKIIQYPKDAAELAKEDSKLLHRKMRQIQSEINTVGQIRHRNLVPLLAHASRPDCHYLVYEFMKNGSLQDLLSKVDSGERELDWLARHKIALGVAVGLEYLHMIHCPTIIHRDLKPANILLDDDMEAHIADFGLAKAMSDAQTHITTSIVAGTVGYIAPEYHQILKFSEKSDIYSFGVVLGVLVIGKFPSDEFFQHTDEMSLVRWMRKVITSENPKAAIDARLLGNGYDEQMLLVLRIAFFCTMDNPKQRPNSADVRHMLSEIKH